MRKQRLTIQTSPFDLTEEQWQVVAHLIPSIRKDNSGSEAADTGRLSNLGGRPAVPDRPILNGILWKLRTGIPWYSLPQSYPSFQTCQRRYYAWVQAGAMQRILHALAYDLAERGGIDLFTSLDPNTLKVKDRNTLFSLLHQPAGRPAWQFSTLLLFLSPLREQTE